MDPMNLSPEQDLKDTNFPLIAGWTQEKINVLKPWGNLLNK